MSLLQATRSLQARWEVMELYVRCALAVDEPARIARYAACGSKLVRLGVLDEVDARQRVQRTLLLTTLDEALPRFWRSACLEYASSLSRAVWH